MQFPQKAGLSYAVYVEMLFQQKKTFLEDEQYLNPLVNLVEAK